MRMVTDLLTKKEINHLYIRAIALWGNKAEIRQSIEELGELIVALAKRDRFKNGSTVVDVLEEMADVEIMLEQLKMMFDYPLDSLETKFDALKQQKLERLKRRLGL